MYVNNIKNTISGLRGQTMESPGAFRIEATTRHSGSQGPLFINMGIVQVSFSHALGPPPRFHLSQAEGRMWPMMQATKSTFLKSSHADCYFMGWSWKLESMWNRQCQHLLTPLVQIATLWDDQESLKVDNMSSERKLLLTRLVRIATFMGSSWKPLRR